ncbi:hypothetical protein BDN71DRAFT_1497935 [Pleurotus eryngii]|uniref:Uncharacterized protein n=1 Tax=Pleurotus eryngii TaxID=5323 RepID=A0A9P5ZS16_PLEER|nr:hypothetical protein BDN71DRAFT_1497935 [Pleurotus eryngii]
MWSFCRIEQWGESHLVKDEARLAAHSGPRWRRARVIATTTHPILYLCKISRGNVRRFVIDSTGAAFDGTIYALRDKVGAIGAGESPHPNKLEASTMATIFKRGLPVPRELPTPTPPWSRTSRAPVMRPDTLSVAPQSTPTLHCSPSRRISVGS